MKSCKLSDVTRVTRINRSSWGETTPALYGYEIEARGKTFRLLAPPQRLTLWNGGKHIMMDSTFDLPAFLLSKLYDNMDLDDGWTLPDAIALAEDIRRYDGIDCDPQEIYEIMQEFHEQDADDED